MKNLLSLSLFLLLFASSKNSSTQNTSYPMSNNTVFSFKMVQYYSESSKDSHSHSTSLSLEKNVLYYVYSYKGFPDAQDENKQINVSNTTINSLKEELKELSLCKDYQKNLIISTKGELYNLIL